MGVETSLHCEHMGREWNVRVMLWELPDGGVVQWLSVLMPVAINTTAMPAGYGILVQIARTRSTTASFANRAPARCKVDLDTERLYTALLRLYSMLVEYLMRPQPEERDRDKAVFQASCNGGLYEPLNRRQ
jgi:hypothetical protein